MSVRLESKPRTGPGEARLGLVALIVVGGCAFFWLIVFALGWWLVAATA